MYEACAIAVSSVIIKTKRIPVPGTLQYKITKKS
jgi:hypothetical protein